MSFLIFVLLVVVYMLGVFNAMRLWPMASIDYDENGEEFAYILPDRTKNEDIIQIYFWPVGCIHSYYLLFTQKEYLEDDNDHGMEDLNAEKTQESNS